MQIILIMTKSLYKLNGPNEMVQKSNVYIIYVFMDFYIKVVHDDKYVTAKIKL